MRLFFSIYLKEEEKIPSKKKNFGTYDNTIGYNNEERRPYNTYITHTEMQDYNDNDYDNEDEEDLFGTPTFARLLRNPGSGGLTSTTLLNLNNACCLGKLGCFNQTLAECEANNGTYHPGKNCRRYGRTHSSILFPISSFRSKGRYPCG